MSITLNPRESGEHIVRHAKYLKVLPAGIERLVEEIVSGVIAKRIDVENFSQHELHPRKEDLHAANWIFIVDTLNFCFWTPTNYTKYKVNGYTGYFALCAAINRAIADGLDMTNPEFYSKLDLDTLSHIFRADDAATKMPLLEQRLECLHQVGERLLAKWNGQFENVVKAAKHSAVELLQLVVAEFPCYRDEAEFAGERVAIWKRVQILVGDLWSCYRGEGLGHFSDIEKVTMFADYRVPQVLVHFGSLEYSSELMELLKQDTILQNGDAREVEIRGASIYIIEQVKDRVLEILKQKHPDVDARNVNSILIDQYLWDYRREHATELEYIPFHKVLSIYY
ncbi:queuosine salvage protein [Drosophila grimshawi]|uniref:Queuosine 5'-phosphate N-glycosylase/hydrolase n=1 Tax=Drosophila grimshawi TaxID=7222 RepID=B4J7F6_DROGR|nr:queuosine salvage protein [Drosophila grimshawi]EDW01080.1 GH20649 [Drosophila grimshawi]